MKALVQRLRLWLWRDTPTSTPIRWIRQAARFAYGLLRDLGAGNISLHAMALVYATLLATVPFIAFSFSVLRGLNVHIELQPLLNEFLLPLGEQGEQISMQIIDMVNNVSGGVLGGVSLVLFLYTALAMVQKIEASINLIWHVRRPRHIGRRLIDYTAIMLLVPLMLSAALASIATLESTALYQQVNSMIGVAHILSALGKLTPVVLIALLFMMLYVSLPNTRVRPTAALFGALVAAVLWALASMWFKDLVVYSTRTRAIYAGFAIAISALLWLYVNWLILLLGARLAFYFQHRDYLRIGKSTIRLSPQTHERLSLDLIVRAADAIHAGGRSPTVDSLAEKMAVPSAVLDEVARALCDAGLLHITQNNALVPGFDLHTTSLGNIVHQLRTLGDDGLAHRPHVLESVDALSDALDTYTRRDADQRTLLSLLPSTQRAAESVASDSHATD
ncbi:MAG: YihY/virulence factor BrkB family protein [Pseudomonadota bacterium]